MWHGVVWVRVRVVGLVDLLVIDQKDMLCIFNSLFSSNYFWYLILILYNSTKLQSCWTNHQHKIDEAHAAAFYTHTANDRKC